MLKLSIIWAGVWFAALALVFGSEFVTDFAFAAFMIRHNMPGFLLGFMWAAVAAGPFALIICIETP